MQVYYGDAVDPSSTTTICLIHTNKNLYNPKACQFFFFVFFFLSLGLQTENNFTQLGKNPAGEEANLARHSAGESARQLIQETHRVSQVHVVMEQTRTHARTDTHTFKNWILELMVRKGRGGKEKPGTRTGPAQVCAG